MPHLNVNNPWNGKVINKLKLQNSDTIEKIIKASHNIVKKKQYLQIPQRLEILNKLILLIEKNIDSLAIQASKEGGKIIKDSMIEIRRGIDGIKSCTEILRTEAGNVIPMNINEASKNRIAFTQKEPIGLVLAISAFNHPFNLIIHQVLPAIATGCPVIVKPSEETPLSCRSLIEFLYEAGLPESYCQMILPEKLEIATKIVSDPRISFLSFIGSSKVGWYLRSKLSPGARCSLEHGGMAPLFLENDTNVKDAVASVTRAGFYHAGQVCVSVQKIFVHEEIIDVFNRELLKSLKKIVIGNQLKKNTDLGPLIRPNEVLRVNEWVQNSIKNGAKLLIGGEEYSDTAYKPTVLLNPSDDDEVSTKEIFGPVVCIYNYKKIDDAIARVNKSDVAFQSAIFTNKISRCLNFFKKINASAVFHNEHTAFRVDWMPFAGLKTSGLGIGGIRYSMHDMQTEKMLVLKH